jgi:large subunit ribosomal protein L30
MAAEATLRVTQRRSANGSSPRQRETLRSLGLRGIGRSVELPDRPELRGMIEVVSHLVEVDPAGSAKRDGTGNG